VVCLPFEYPEAEDGVSKILVGFVVCRASDLVVLLGNVLSFFEDRREIVVSHDSWRSECASAPLRAQKNLTNIVG
jgi:hypothetical protein